MSTAGFYPDSAVKAGTDLLDFRRFVNPLAEVLAAPQTTTPFTVGVFGPWGSGKTCLLTLLQEALEARYPDRFLVVVFNPWVHRREPNMLVPLLHALHDATQTKWSEVRESGKKILDVLTRLGGDLLLKTITVNAVDLDRLEKLEKQYLETHRAIESEMRKLRQTLEEWAAEIAGSGPRDRRIVFMIDDLDRCEPSEIIDLLEAVKLFLDVPHIIVVLAVDKEIIDRGIQVRYNKFDFAATGREAAVGAEYLEKMIQLPIALPPLGQAQLDQMFKSLKVQEVLPDHHRMLARLVPPNPRKIKRILNMIALTKAFIAQTEDLPPLDLGLVIRLIVLQVQNSALYAEITNRPRFLQAMQQYYVDRAADKPTNFTVFGENADAFKGLCLQFYSPGGYLSELFRGRPFDTVILDPQGGFAREKLETYLNLTVPIAA